MGEKGGAGCSLGREGGEGACLTASGSFYKISGDGEAKKSSDTLAV